jgi:hypothetical protein
MNENDMKNLSVMKPREDMEKKIRNERKGEEGC